jgi:N utilization substance protein A
MVKKLFALEVPEIADGTVEIASIALEAGHRTKIAVRSTVPGVNAKGACIGPMGQRVRAVMSELHGEKIDIIDWSDDPAAFVGNALSPAKALRVEVVDAATRTARVTVPDFQLYPNRRIRKILHNLPLHLNRVVLRHQRGNWPGPKPLKLAFFSNDSY